MVWRLYLSNYLYLVNNYSPLPLICLSFLVAVNIILKVIFGVPVQYL
ncbi:hypothetical protein MuYL_1187 [Mucilaginibacter xinganensis]|uniref:Uncharacterized protein n=1 Tax=Mucilaginibacter xinganensis TaxID=1234841 RepID=A0A223NTB0_9SPHI|nr:hypothetical protein MuYL_1187 [Mucilaginibacter xinganensis]